MENQNEEVNAFLEEEDEPSTVNVWLDFWNKRNEVNDDFVDVCEDENANEGFLSLHEDKCYLDLLNSNRDYKLIIDSACLIINKMKMKMIMIMKRILM